MAVADPGAPPEITIALRPLQHHLGNPRTGHPVDDDTAVGTVRDGTDDQPDLGNWLTARVGQTPLQSLGRTRHQCHRVALDQVNTITAIVNPNCQVDGYFASIAGITDDPRR